MKAAVIFFSGTGNTHKVGKWYCENLESIGYDVQLIDVSKNDNKIENYDLIVLGSPTYSKVAIKKIHDFMNEHLEIKHLKHSKFMTYITHGWRKAFGHISLMKHLELLGASVVSAQAYLMPNNYYMMAGKKHKKTEMIKIYTDSRNQVSQVIKAYQTNSITIDKKSTIKRKMMEKLYKHLRKDYIPNFAVNFLSVDDNKCTNCGLCVKSCPNRNIRLNQQKIEFQTDCLACARCFNICPMNAFSVKGKTVDQYQENKGEY